MSGHKLVIVESPAKAKTINKYLGSDYTVLASFGHVRDLPPKDGSVRPDDDFAMSWELGDRAARPVGEITKALKDADTLYLATDPDREGEAIAWHVQEVLEHKKLLKGKKVHRITFNEITKSAVKDAIENPRALDQPLIDAYMARRALDYLVGFSLSPVLWRKLPGARSAGRVQSVALRLICQREDEIEKFIPQEYWTIEAVFTTDTGAQIPARLSQYDGKKVEKFTFTNEKDAKAAFDKLNSLNYTVGEIERKQTKRNPYAPFTTSTLQQEASRKLGMGASRTMRMAQQLYEGMDIGGETIGLITYMRTDGIYLSNEAIAGARNIIGKEYGDKYLPSEPRIYKSVVKNAQEAHEAVRPTDLSRLPSQVARYLEPDALRLYTLIWQRTVASQMESAILDQVAIDIVGSNKGFEFRANGSVVLFDGFLKAYEEEKDDTEAASDEDKQSRLPNVKTGEALKKNSVTPNQHFTEPPPRYSEASLIKKLEELGIGRPSTYTSIIQVLQDRDYVVLDKKRFVPEDRGRIVTTFLNHFFERYVEYGFTASLEEQLDKVSEDKLNWKALLRDFWKDFSAAIDGTKELKIRDVIDALDENLGPHFFPDKGDGVDPRLCKSCNTGRLGLRLGKNGAFVGCSNYPECKYTAPLVAGEAANAGSAEPKLLGNDPVTNMPVTLRNGPYGMYVQLDRPESAAPPAPKEEVVEDEVDATKDSGGKKKKKKKAKKEKGPQPKRSSLPKGLDPATIDLDIALKLLALPRDVGPYPETGEVIQAGVGRFGPYLKLGSVYKSIPKDEDVLTIGLNRATVLMAEALEKRKAMQGRDVGEHPADKKMITVQQGRFGAFVKHGKVMATLPKGTNMDALTLAEAVEILAKKAAKGAAPKKGKASNDDETTEPKKAAPKGKSKAAKAEEKAAPKKKAVKKKKAA
ncbi:MAG: type I DNA topoisomerase [Alphaproteobacteria bacterium]|nr:type I DNA topoisomerase [Alphaproteobacteria bacterium]